MEPELASYARLKQRAKEEKSVIRRDEKKEEQLSSCAQHASWLQKQARRC